MPQRGKKRKNVNGKKTKMQKKRDPILQNHQHLKTQKYSTQMNEKQINVESNY